MIASLATVSALIYGIFRNLKGDIDTRFKDIKSEFKDIKSDITIIRADLVDIKERLSYLEAANIYTMPLEPSVPNIRSLKAKEMWKRRKQKKLPIHDQKT